MKKIIFGLLLVTSFAFSQDTTADVNQDGWKKSGTFSFIGNQATFNNWLAGGQSSLSGNILVNYDFNYKKGDWSLDNKIMAGYGITKLKEADIQKSDDRIEFNSLLGKKASGLWFYSAFFNFKTQLDTGLDPDTQTVRISHFFSPAFFQFGPGMMWKKSDNLKFNIAPLTSKLIIVHDEFTQGGLTSFGVETGETSRYELGASLSGYYKFNAMKNVSFENIVSLYSNYLEDPQNVDLNYQLNVVMSINKHLTTNLTFQTIYDDNAFRGFQTRQNIGLGVNYGF
tara:strand:- start:54 stop:902 length:849 start_codon:yes stop_codon:yes gene_type:complete